MMLHSHASHGTLAELLIEKLGAFGVFLDEVVLHSLLEVLNILPFLFLTYLLMEFIEHKAGERTESFLRRSGKLGPAIGGALGLLPQCGFSAVAANLFSARIVSMGTLVAVFLSTSDEMVPILISNPDISITGVIVILVYKLAAALAAGFAIDLVIHLTKREREEINIDEICEGDNCHCERGILYSALHHTVSISLFVLLVSVAVSSLVFFVGEQRLSSLTLGIPVISHLIAAVFGLIPNCAASVALCSFYTGGFISAGAMLSGLFSGSGVGLLVLFRVNRHLRTNLIIVGILVLLGVLFGTVADLVGIGALLG